MLMGADINIDSDAFADVSAMQKCWYADMLFYERFGMWATIVWSGGSDVMLICCYADKLIC